MSWSFGTHLHILQNRKGLSSISMQIFLDLPDKVQLL
jgi:hypothetical protein